jgi:hypothetical protein
MTRVCVLDSFHREFAFGVEISLLKGEMFTVLEERHSAIFEGTFDRLPAEDKSKLFFL